MKIVCISDTHSQPSLPTLPKGDVLIHAGDMCLHGNMGEVERTADWLGAIRENYKRIIVIAGNHDFVFQEHPTEARRLLESRGITYLKDQEVVVDGLRFYGSPWTPPFLEWAFMKERREIREVWGRIPTNTDVLITHGPPFGILDPGLGVPHVGCEELRQQYVDRLEPILHVFGHLHSGYGRVNGKFLLGRDTEFVNASLVNEAYSPVNKPIVVEI